MIHAVWTDCGDQDRLGFSAPLIEQAERIVLYRSISACNPELQRESHVGRMPVLLQSWCTDFWRMIKMTPAKTAELLYMGIAQIPESFRFLRRTVYFPRGCEAAGK